jgi:acyl-coenzyme A synthetase/AMP-(fatty) acid ligase
MKARSLREALIASRLASRRFLWTNDSEISLDALADGSYLGGRVDELRGRSVLLSTRDQLSAALALIEIDGIARRIILCPPDLAREHLPFVISTAEVDAIVSSDDGFQNAETVACHVHCSDQITPSGPRGVERSTEWVLFTSGTTGVPKMVVHSLSTLAGAIEISGMLAGAVVWCTFYDIRRYGGLQILLRALFGGGSLVLSSPAESMEDFLSRAATRGATHVTGTPSHWRRVLTSQMADRIAPTYARLSGEIADQAILDRLHATYPQAIVAHAFASTEAGVAFEVRDGLAGFPASDLGSVGPVEMKVENGSLRIRSPRTALRYVGNQTEPLLDENGFVDTGDMIEQRGDRCFFAGRRGGIINIGGLKVHPEEVEAVINRHPNVRMSLVTARRNPITGAVVVADVVLLSPVTGSGDVKSEILDVCRRELAPHKVPVTVRIVSSLEVTPSGKMVRPDA